MLPKKRFSAPLLFLCSALMFVSGIVLIFVLPPLPDNGEWLLIFPVILLFTCTLPYMRAAKEYNTTLIAYQNSLLDDGFPLHRLNTVDPKTLQELFKKHGFRNNGQCYMKKRIFSLRNQLLYNRSVTGYVRWLDNPADDIRTLLEREYHDFTCLYDTFSNEKWLILFIRRETLTPSDTEAMTAFCMTLLRDELNLRHASLPTIENTPLPRVREQVYCHAHMILPVLTDSRGTAHFMDASVFARPSSSPYCTYAECCRMLNRLFSSK